MIDDPTQDLTAVDMLRLALADVRGIKAGLGAVEAGQAALQATVEDRLKDTRPIWHACIFRANMNAESGEIGVHIRRNTHQ
jgi:hypothetical protein